MENTQGKSWQHLRSEAGPDLIIFRARFDWLQNPRNDSQMRAVVLESADWVNIVALTPEQKIVLVNQYRFGIRQATLEIPAGLVEAGEPPLQAAQRELREETGYTSEEWVELGWVQANPAFMSNRCFLWLAKNVVQSHATQLDVGEDVRIETLPWDDLRQAIQDGRTRNPFTLLSLSQVFDLRGGLVRPR
jgi:8-oxo-dGTP pyrophosphatase MutT (NUDIX family)